MKHGLEFFTAENLLVYPPEHIIYGDYAYEVWDEQMIKYVLGFFTPDNMRIDVISKFFDKSQGISLIFIYLLIYINLFAFLYDLLKYLR